MESELHTLDETVVMEESPPVQVEVVTPPVEVAQKPDLDKFFLDIGLASPLDYCFLNFAQSKSRQNIDNGKEALQFLFHLSSREDLESKRPFPKSMFLEKLRYGETTKNVLYTLIPSPTWNERETHSFGDFHLYFMDHMKPSTPYSVEEIYKILDEKRGHGEKYFVTSGDRVQSSDKKIHILFVTAQCILAFVVEEFADEPDDEYFSSKWISFTEQAVIRVIHEVDVFEFPDHYLVMTEEEAQNSHITEMETGEPECKECGV